MKYIISVKEQGIERTYDDVARAMGIDPKDVSSYDCRKIKVSKEIADAIEATYEGDKMSFGMHWLCFGPKVDESLTYGEVEVEDGFINK